MLALPLIFLISFY